MKARTVCLSFLIALGMQAQRPAVPRVISFSGVAQDISGKPQTGLAGITFALYEEQQGGVPLWTETQNVALDDQGRYTVSLGSTQTGGLPQELFSNGKARWLGVELQTPGTAEQPRVLLVGVPYALKAADADTLGGLPASAFLQASALAAASHPAGDSGIKPDAAHPDVPDVACTKITSDGKAKANEVTKFTAACRIEPSAIFESGGQVGIGTTTPAATLDVNGTAAFEGPLTINALGEATATAGANSNPFDLVAASFDSTTSSSVGQRFRWQAESAGNNSAAPSGTLNLLYGEGGGSPAETGLSINSNGQLTFAAGQTFPGTGTGTITGVTAGTGLSGGGNAGNVTLTNTGVLAVSGGTGITSTGGNTPMLSLNTAFTDGRYLQLTGGSLTGALNLPANGLTVAGNQLVLAGGNVGIGTATPGALLEVAGNMKISGAGSTLIFPDGTTQATAAAGTAGLIAVNPEQVALLKWFPTDQSASFAVGTSPGYVAFDGASIWVTNSVSNNVTKLLASTGAVVGTYNAGLNPAGVAFDGANIWVAARGSGYLIKLSAATGATLGNTSVGGTPQGVAFDGANIWVADPQGGRVVKVLASSGAVAGTYTLGGAPYGVAFDGTNVWVTNSGTNNVTELVAASGTVIGTYSVGSTPNGIAFDGANIWVANSAGGSVTKIQASTGTVLGTYTVANAWLLAFDGANIWVTANAASGAVTKLRASDGANLGTFAVGSAAQGVAFDGVNIWVTNHGSNTVSKL